MIADDIIKEFKAKTIKPLYLLHGEEPYFIDTVTKAAEQHILDKNERDFNLTILYGKDVNLDQLLERVKQYPMMAERQVVIIKEAQHVRSWDKLNAYFENPVSSTVLILAHKYKKADTRKKFVKSINKNGSIFLSKKLYENQIASWIENYLSGKAYKINQKAAAMLVDHLGTDLSRITTELDKLMIILQKETIISAAHIEENIGISKDYNAFELINAIAVNNIFKANQIIYYFEKNPKAGPLVVIISSLFNFFESLMKVQFLKIQDLNGIMKGIKVTYPAAKNIMAAKRYFNIKKVAQNIQTLHQYDLKSKGINRGSAEDGDLLKELVFLLLH